jgi:hypothetical protein
MALVIGTTEIGTSVIDTSVIDTTNRRQWWLNRPAELDDLEFRC